MKKIILSAILFATITTTGVFAKETKNLEYKIDTTDTKETMNNIKGALPKLHELLTDYFQAKTCKVDFVDRVSTEDIKEFMETYQYGVLVGLKYQESPINKANYIALISAYKAMNCGSEDAMGNYIAATSVTEINNDKQRK